MIQSAVWDSSHEMLTVEIDAQTDDETIILSNINTDERIAITRITADSLWVARRTLATINAIPCVVEAVSNIRTHRLAVINAPNCNTTEGNILPVPTITQPAGTVTIPVGQSLTFKATITDPDNNGPYSYYWNFAGATVATKTTTDAQTSTTDPITFTESGNYAVLLRVTDATGEYSLQNAQRHILVIDSVAGINPPDPITTPTPSPTPTPNPNTGEQPVVVTKEALGRTMFFDIGLSDPIGLSCSSCHDPAAGWSDPDHGLPVSIGPINNPSIRNAPSLAYAALTPEFVGGFSPNGGLFRDGSAINLLIQAKVSLLSINQMGNTSKASVVQKVQASAYANSFEQLYGEDIFDDIGLAFEKVAETLIAFESSDELNSFSSKFDAVLADQTQLSAEEQLGFDLFNGKAFCASCHTPRQIGDTPPMFTNFGYRNLGLPKNILPPFDALPAEFVDLGLGTSLNDSRHDGKFKVPSLRNVEKTAPYMHNGVLTTLEEVVRFKNTRDVPGTWPDSEISENRVEGSILGDLGLSTEEEAAIVAFLITLTDDFTPEPDQPAAAEPTPPPPPPYGNY